MLFFKLLLFIICIIMKPYKNFNFSPREFLNFIEINFDVH